MKHLSRLLRDENLYLGLLCIPMMIAILKGSTYCINHVDGVAFKIGIAVIALFLTLKMTHVAGFIIHLAKSLYKTCVGK